MLARLTPVAVACAYVLWLVLTSRDLGYSRDEGFYFHAADAYGRWFELLIHRPSEALEQATVDAAFKVNHEHPVLMKSLFWLSRATLFEPVFKPLGLTLGFSYRFPAMVLSGAAVGTVYAWGRRAAGPLAGAVAAVSLAAMPRVFYHSHLACFDMPIAALWLITTYAYFLSVEQRSAKWAVASAVLYGLMLNTKHNAWLLPPALAIHALLLAAMGQLRLSRRQAVRAWLPPLAWWLMVSWGPLQLWLTWPWLWADTTARLAEYFKFHVQHVFYNMEFLGTTYFEPPFPRAYAWVMTLATVPATTLGLFALGACFKASDAWRLLVEWRLRRSQGRGLQAAAVHRLPGGYGALWGGCVLLSYAPWLSASTPIFGGTKHWITAYPFMALFAGVAVARLCRAALPVRFWSRRLLALGVLSAAAAAPVVMTVQSHPYGLSAYTPIVGGSPGAATLGLNRTFWGYTTASLAEPINQRVARRGNLYLHDTLGVAFQMMQKDGLLRSDIRAASTVSGSDWAIYHHEQHMSRVEHMIWTDYGTVRPAAVGLHQGVPVTWFYERPRNVDHGTASPE